MKRSTILVTGALLVAACSEADHPFDTDQVRSLAPAAACVAPPADLVSWWPGDDHANDIAGFNHGSFNGSYAAGRVGQAFSFDGGNTLQVADNATLDFSTELTIDAWINPTSTTAAAIINKYISGDGLRGYDMLLVNGKLVAFAASEGEGDGCVGTSTSTIPTGQWTHVAFTIDATSCTLYVNGLAEVTDPGIASIQNNSNPFCIGAREGCTQNHFQGQIDEVEAFDRALSAAEIKAIHDAGSNGKCKPQCQGRAQTTTGTVNGAQIDLTAGNDVWVGTSADETVYGYGGKDRMCGRGGADELHGGDDQDKLQGDNGPDLLFGENNDDKLYGNAGKDHLDGGAGSDKCSGGGGVNTQVDCES